MNTFISSEKFRLELKWNEVIYTREGECIFKGAYFTGPVLQIAEKINDNDNMMLDFYSQYIALVKGSYVAKFYWTGTNYSEDGLKVYLKGAVMSHDVELNNVPNLINTDYFVIDTSDHTFDIHQYHLVYKTLLVNSNHTSYRFTND